MTIERQVRRQAGAGSEGDEVGEHVGVRLAGSCTQGALVGVDQVARLEESVDEEVGGGLLGSHRRGLQSAEGRPFMGVDQAPVVQVTQVAREAPSVQNRMSSSGR